MKHWRQSLGKSGTSESYQGIIVARELRGRALALLKLHAKKVR